MTLRIVPTDSGDFEARTTSFDARTSTPTTDAGRFVVTESGARIRLASTGDPRALRRARIADDGRCVV